MILVCAVYKRKTSMTLLIVFSSAIHGDLVVTFAVSKEDIAGLLHQILKSRFCKLILPSRKALVACWAFIWALLGICGALLVRLT